MLNFGSLLVNSLDYVMIVDKNFNMIYNSRYDLNFGESSDLSMRDIAYKNYFDIYPELKFDESSISRCLSTGEIIVQKNQEYVDFCGRKFITNNVTIPLRIHGEITAAVELTMDAIAIKKDKNLANKRFDDFVKKVQDASGMTTFSMIMTNNCEMKKSIEKAKVLSTMRNPTLIYGETGTGKELFAQAMINYSGVPRDKVVIQNCAAVPEGLIESILFGTVKGAYTGAENHKGLFDIADGGIIFLDELNSMPFGVQAKLLRVIQDGTFRPVGSNKDKRVHVKIIAAINTDPVEAIEQQILRKDLFYRFSSGLITLLPLRERREDIELFVEYYVRYYSDLYNKFIKGISEELLNAFMKFDWEGNVRELMNAIEFMVTSAPHNTTLTFEMLPGYIKKQMKISEKEIPEPDFIAELEAETRGDNEGSLSYRKSLEKLEKAMIESALKESNYNKSKAAEILGLPRQTLRYRMKILGIK